MSSSGKEYPKKRRRSAPLRAVAASVHTMGTKLRMSASFPWTGGITIGHVYQVVRPRPDAERRVDLNCVLMKRLGETRMGGGGAAPDRMLGLGCWPFIRTYQLRLPCSFRSSI